MKKYLDCVITTHEGKTIHNPLKLSEAHLISKMAQENKEVTVKAKECEDKYYKLTFG